MERNSRTSNTCRFCKIVFIQVPGRFVVHVQKLCLTCFRRHIIRRLNTLYLFVKVNNHGLLMIYDISAGDISDLFPVFKLKLKYIILDNYVI